VGTTKRRAEEITVKGKRRIRGINVVEKNEEAHLRPTKRGRIDKKKPEKKMNDLLQTIFDPQQSPSLDPTKRER